MKSIMSHLKSEDSRLITELTMEMADSITQYPRGVVILSLQTLMLSCLSEWKDVDSKINEEKAKERSQVRFMELMGYMLEELTDNTNEAQIMLVTMLDALGADIKIVKPEDDMENWGNPSFE